MSIGIRPDERNNDRNKIGKEVYAFLKGVESNTSDLSMLRLDSAIDILRNVGAMATAELSIPNPFLTGAITAVLPMRIAIADRNNNRLEFQMLINPSTLNYGKISTVNSSYTRGGYVTQVWGTNQALLTSNGTTAAFFIEGGGLTNVARRRSFAYGNFLSFLYAYRNNGYDFYDPTDLKYQITRVINVIHGVEIYYDNQTFMGHFNNFTMDENADRPFLFDYNFEFIISSLDGNYDEIGGHFSRIPPNTITETNTRILKDLDEQQTIYSTDLAMEDRSI